jgi:ElaB/YqjD/DUF883 family membrane-anchored ribosome-binding protein
MTNTTPITHRASQALDNGLAVAEHTADRVVERADAALRASQRGAHQALDALSTSVDDLRHAGSASMQRAADTARRAGASTVTAIRNEPVKSVLIAAAAGALVVGLLSLFGSRHRG